jgi:uncharacterized membrane protein
MARVKKSIEVNVPVRTAYNQWTQFEEFPEFMEGVRHVTQLDDRRMRWTAEVGGHEKTWEAEIQEQIPDTRIIWRSTEGEENAGIVTFEPIDGGSSTRVGLEMSYHPEGFAESVGDALGFMSRRVEGDLRRFRDFIEERGVETGAFRETLPNRALAGGFTAGEPAVRPDGRHG